MKKIALTILTLTTMSAFAQESSRIETRTRSLGEEIIGVSKCTQPEGGSYATSELAYNSRNEMVSVPATRLEASSKITVKKCILVEDYQVDVTGSFWNSKSSEKPGTSRQRTEIREVVQSISNGQTIRDQKDTIYGDNTVSVAINILEGLKARSKQECDAKRSQLMQQVTKQSKCNVQE
jgi:hypothetical protein